MISTKNILVIGSGLMAESLISYLLINPVVKSKIFRTASTLRATFLKMLRN